MKFLSVDSTKCAKMRARVHSWFNRKSFSPKRLRDQLLGVMITTTLGEVCAYKLLKQDISAGDLPTYTTDVAIVTLAVFEALVAPFISWWGYRHRRTLLIGYTAIVTVCLTSWFFLPDAGKREESGYCKAGDSFNKTEFLRVPSRTAARLVVVIYTCIAFVLARVACWSHGIAYSDEFAPDRTSVHYGVLVVGRALPLALGYRLLTGAVDNNLTLQTALLTIGITSNLIQLLFVMPRTVPEVDGVQKTALPLEERNFLLSTGRVFNNSLAMTQIFAMGLLAAALWGYLYHEIDIVKVKFNLIPDRGITIYLAELHQYPFLIAVVAYAGTLFAVPILMKFSSSDAIRQVIKTSVFAIIAYVFLTTMLRCDYGNVAGLDGDYYNQPQCSAACQCSPRLQEFEPVCVVEDMTTYLSPCQAGCGPSEFVNGIRVFSNCTCAAGGRAVLGACSDVICRQYHRLHSMVLFITLTFTLLAFQAQGVLLLRTVDPRDKAVVMGMACSMVAVITFVCGHLVFLGIRVGTCRWYEANQCQLQSKIFPYLVGSISVFLAFLSLLISIMSGISIRAANKNNSPLNTRL